MGEEPLDRNKTPLTHRITALAVGYLSVIGCKPIETEVKVCGYGVIDVGSFCYPTMTELKKSKLFRTMFDSALHQSDWTKDGVFRERYGNLLLVGVEVKVSVSDFRRDIDKKYAQTRVGCYPPLHLAYLAVPKSLEDEANKVLWWGKIICSEDGERILKISAPTHINPMHPGDMTDFVAQVAIRREHRTKYRAMRDFLKTMRARG